MHRLSYIHSPANEPYDLWNHGSGMNQMLEFYDYRQAIDRKTIMRLLQVAISWAMRHPINDRIAIREVQCWEAGIQLILFPEPQMTWQMWRNALSGMGKFAIRMGMSYGFSFIVMEQGKNLNHP